MNPFQLQPARRKAPRLLSLLLATLLAGPLLAQTGPGGVGNSTTNRVWLDAGRLTNLSNGARVGQWPDASGNNWHANQTNLSYRPSYVASGLNGRPVLNFNRTQATQFLDITNAGIGTDVMSNSNTLMAVVRINSAGVNNYQAIAVHQGFHTGLNTSGPTGAEGIGLVQYVGGTISAPASGSGNTILTLAGSTAPVSWNIAAMQNSETASGTVVSLFVNSSPSGQQSSTSQMSNFGFNMFRIGAAHASGMWYGGLNGDIAEVIIYKVSLNGAERIVVENYLSAKYNLPIANKYYADNSTFNHDVQGIGTTNGTAKHSQAGNGKGLLLAELNGSLNGPAAEFLFAGHNSPANALVSPAASGAVAEQWQRSWYVQKTGSIDAKLSFDWSESGLAATDLAATFADYVLLYRADLQSSFVPVGRNGTALAPGLENGDQLSFALADAELKSGYYTLGKVLLNAWTGAVSTDWHTGGNWSKNSVPTANHKVVIGTAARYPELGAAAVAGDLLVDGGQLTLGSFALTAGGEVKITVSKVLSGGGTIQAAEFADLRNNTFQGDITLRRTGRGNNNWGGGNTFSGRFNLENKGTAPIAPATLANDVFVK